MSKEYIELVEKTEKLILNAKRTLDEYIHSEGRPSDVISAKKLAEQILSDPSILIKAEDQEVDYFGLNKYLLEKTGWVKTVDKSY